MALDKASLAPGFRFHPTDEELVVYYLKRKISGKPFRFDAIAEIDVYKSEPSDLPDKSRLKSKDLEWYFFSFLDKKYGNGSRTNRATERGYWKTTGKDRPVLHKAQTVGMKKTLVYHSGRAPRGERTNWVMHEYRLIDEQLEKSGNFQDVFVLCRIFQKSGSGPKNGEQYGAPFIEEEWVEEELVMVPGNEAAEDDDAYVNGNDIDQIFGVNIPSEDVPPLPFSFYYGDDSSNVQKHVDFVDGAQKLLVPDSESYYSPEQPTDTKLLDFPVENHMVTTPVKDEYTGEPSNTVNSVDADYLLDEPFFDATSYFPFGFEEFLETNDLSNPIEVDGYDALCEHFTFFDPEAFDASMMTGSESIETKQALFQKPVSDGAQQESIGSQQQLSQGHGNDIACSANQKPGNSGSGTQSSAVKKASRMLGDIDAPPAFASEFPEKGAALLLNSASHSSNPVHTVARMIHIGDMARTYWSLEKRPDYNILLSLALSKNDANSASLEPMAGIHTGKVGSIMAWGWLYLFFVWALILSASCKIGSYFYKGNAA
ncbi:NAC domain-containing protein [Actinidia chinensis var. chinensis]|uniref:NAC domain-containing protein n=1 Tax=Actinidia chinensis var. chinensis TaxID=1590841 RepID=A0A2R6PYN5_ACTCC|nr:NAC domain-containing protein [Actinidia chinensis var. chinensis]